MFHPDRPRVFESLDEPIADVAIHDCPWLTDAEFRHRGGVILWDRRIHPDGLPEEVRRRLGIVEQVNLPPIPCQTGARVPPAEIGAAIVPPTGSD